MQPRCQSLFPHLPRSSIVIRASQITSRAYATETTPLPEVVKNPLQRKKGGDLGSHLPKHVIPVDSDIPPYPYGDYALFKQANRGLYGEQMIQFGNNVSRKTETKTRRIWKPNVLTKSLYSVALKKKIKLRVTAKVLKVMDREGGLDEYLLKDSEHRLKELGPLGWQLRWTILQKPEVVARMRAEAAALGVDQATINKQWPVPKATAHTTSPISAGQSIKQSRWERTKDLVENIDETQKFTILATYHESDTAAKHYLEQGLVDTLSDGYTVFFLRDQALFINEQDSSAKPTAKQIDHIRAQLSLPPAFGEAWQARVLGKSVPLETDASTVKAKYAALIKEAASQATYASDNVERVALFKDAMRKANKAIDIRVRNNPHSILRALRESGAEVPELNAASRGKDAWGAIVQASKEPVASSLNV